MRLQSPDEMALLLREPQEATLKLSPQPQRLVSFGFLKTKPE
jgi:hypothetical protein